MKIVGGGLVADVVTALMAGDDVAGVRLAQGVNQQCLLPVIEIGHPAKRAGRLGEFGALLREVILERGDGFFDHAGLMQEKVGQVVVVGLGVQVRPRA